MAKPFMNLGGLYFFALNSVNLEFGRRKFRNLEENLE